MSSKTALLKIQLPFVQLYNCHPPLINNGVEEEGKVGHLGDFYDWCRTALRVGVQKRTDILKIKKFNYLRLTLFTEKMGNFRS